MHQAATPSNKESVATSAKIDIEQHKFVRKIVSLIVVVSAVVITLYVWGIIERHPRTDDATARANVVGIAPRVTGQIIGPRMSFDDSPDGGCRSGEHTSESPQIISIA